MTEVETRKRRDALYKHEYFYVSPEAVKLGDKFVTVKGNLVKKDIVGYIVPFSKSLASLLRMPDIQHYIDNSHTGPGDYMFEICDGQYVQSDPLSRRNPRALQVIIHTDDIEMVNPIGSHTKNINSVCFIIHWGTSHQNFGHNFMLFNCWV